MYTLYKMGIAMSMALCMHFHICVHTDYFWGRSDPIGPYPRIPDKEKVKTEIAFAEECKKYYTSPRELFY